ncbi:hypothetical protein ASD90_17950 [Terrabacter sp. Root181]|nr:hypothetical protein ASD90_17950 [Terrabacter sp. Root181]
MLYNLVKEQSSPSLPLTWAAGLAGTLLFAAGVCSGLALRPRLRARESPTSSLYYNHIARKHGKAAGSGEYAELVLQLTANGEKLVNEVAAQIWANAHVARDKYRWINWAMVAFLAALPCLAAVAVIITFGWNL